LILAALLAATAAAWAGQAEPSKPASPLPEAPQPQTPAAATTKAPAPCKPASQAKPAEPTAPSGPQAELPPCPAPPLINWFARFLTGPEVKPLTPKEKARLAMRNLLDPFNGITILGTAAISVGSDSHSPYGPGMPGFGRYVGVSFTQDMTGEFFNTFLVPTIVHQDPHYHRMPKASIPRRVLHGITEVAWTQGDNGKGMLNYATLAGNGIDDEISNLYVPGRETNGSATAARYGISLATSPIDNFITEFLPDVAKRIHIRVVLVQRIINQVAKTDPGSSP
jgi:hypothetical protein